MLVHCFLWLRILSFKYSIQGSTFSNIRDREWLGRASESLVVVSDFSIAGSLIFYLNRSRTGFKRTETMVNRLIIFTINTGLSTSVVATLTLLFVSNTPPLSHLVSESAWCLVYWIRFPCFLITTSTLRASYASVNVSYNPLYIYKLLITISGSSIRELSSSNVSPYELYMLWASNANYHVD